VKREKTLRDKERELLAGMARAEADARITDIAETRNGWAAADSKENLLKEAIGEWNLFTQVRDAMMWLKGAPPVSLRLALPFSDYCGT